jgi:Fe-S cluster biogenesis protein NfuA
VQRELVPVLEAARGRIAMRGWRRFRRPVVELEDGAVWLDFVGACRTRSPLRH